MKCPHCMEGFHDNYEYEQFADDIDGEWYVVYRTCPECNRISIHLVNTKGLSGANDPISNSSFIRRSIMIWPKGSARPPCPPEVPKDFAEDYTEACIVLPDSAKASAALSRRCLQHILRDVAKVKHSDLSSEIQEALDSNKLPSYIAEILDAVRNVGNFAAHPIKSKSSGQIIEVEVGEAELNLDILEALFDFYFVQPARIAEKKAAINKKLQDAGKPPMK